MQDLAHGFLPRLGLLWALRLVGRNSGLCLARERLGQFWGYSKVVLFRPEEDIYLLSFGLLANHLEALDQL